MKMSCMHSCEVVSSPHEDHGGVVHMHVDHSISMEWADWANAQNIAFAGDAKVRLAGHLLQ